MEKCLFLIISHIYKIYNDDFNSICGTDDTDIDKEYRR